MAGQNGNAPLAMFKRTTFQKDKEEIIQKIRVVGSDFRKIYEKVYKKGTNENTFTIPTKNGGPTVYENRATFAKNAAFVLVLGVNQNGDALTATQLNNLAANVLTVIKEADDQVYDAWFEKDGWTGW